MIQECMEVFKEMLDKQSERLILDNHVPKDGTYRLIEMSKDGIAAGEPLDIRYNKKTGEIEGKTDSRYQDICYLDYYSKLIAMNKPVDSKKIIHSNNYFSLAVKKDSLLQNKLTEEILENYYAVLKNPELKYTKPKARMLYQEAKEQLGEVDTGQIEQIESWIKNKEIWEGIDYNRKDYVKIFFVYPDREETKAAYLREGTRYLLPNIYNNNDYNVKVEGKIWGMPNDNIGMNSKKPYLANKGRKISVPYLLDREEVMLRAKLFDYLMGKASADKVNIYVDFDRRKIMSYTNKEIPDPIGSGYYLRLQKGKEVEIHHADVIIDYNPNLQRKFCLKQIIEIPDKALKSYNPYGTKIRLYEIQMLIDEIFFGGRLAYNYFTEPKKIGIVDEAVKNCLIRDREKLFSWFYKGQCENMAAFFDRMSLELIINSVNHDFVIKAKHQLNLRWALMDYFTDDGRMEKKVNNAKKNFIEHLLMKEEWEFVRMDEWCYAVGQIVSYLTGKSKSKNKPCSWVNPFMRANNCEVIKKRLSNMYKKYNYDIQHGKDRRVEIVISRIMGYSSEEKIDAEMICMGFSDYLVLFKKREGEKEDDE